MHARAAAAAAVAVLLGGCSSATSEDRSAASSSSTPGADRTSTLTPTQGPPPPGALESARGYYDAVRRGFVTGDTAALTSQATPDCQACAAVVAGIRDEVEAGNTYRGGEITAFDLVSSTEAPDDVALVVRYSTAPFLLSTAGASPTTVSGAVGARTRVTLQRSGSGWLVRELEPLTAP